MTFAGTGNVGKKLRMCGNFTLREECRLRAFENRVLRRIFGPKRDKVTGELKKYINRNLSTPHQVLFQ